jgi:1-acyl-sn-glycerol-3-phosphate acyltransferase
MDPRDATLGKRLRSALYMTVLIVTVIPYSMGVVLWSWLPWPRRYWMILGWTGFAVWCGRWICGLQYEVRGRENLPDEPAIVMCKHQSAWETLFLTILLPRPLSYVYKRELHWAPFFGWALASLRMIHINRSRGSDAFEQVVEQGTRRLAEGTWIVIFPEGTRTAPGAPPRYKTGGARLAARTGATLIPIALNSGETWPRRSFVKMPGTITVSIGPPIRAEGRSAEELARLSEAWIEDEMHRIAPHRYASPAPAGQTQGSSA